MASLQLEMVDSGGLSGRPELARTLSVQEHTRQLQAEAEERAEQQHGDYIARMHNLATLNVDEIEKVRLSLVACTLVPRVLSGECGKELWPSDTTGSVGELEQWFRQGDGTGGENQGWHQGASSAGARPPPSSAHHITFTTPPPSLPSRVRHTWHRFKPYMIQSLLF